MTQKSPERKPADGIGTDSLEADGYDAGPSLRIVTGGNGEATVAPLTEADLEERARRYALKSKSAATRRAYLSDWRHFAEWCKRMERSALPAEPATVVLYLTAHAEDYKVSTLWRRLSSIAQVHKANGYLDPPTKHSSVHEVFAGIRRHTGTAPNKKAPILTEDIQTLVAVLPQDKLIGKRDRAMILLGFAGAFRRAELVSLNVADIQQTQKGLLITLRKSKTDQEGRGKKKAIPNGQREETCPVRAYQAWIKASGITKGPVFRGVDRHGNLLPKRCCGEAVAIVLKRAAEKAGLDPTVFAGHSLRAGLVTQAIIAGVPIHKIMEQTDHKSERMLREYIRDAEVWRDNAAAATGI